MIISISSLDLDRHQVWIIITSESSLDLDHHHMLSQNGAILILLIIGSSIEPTLHVDIQHLYLTLSQKGLHSSYIWPHLVRKACPALTSDLILSETLRTYIRSCASTSHRKCYALRSNPILSERHNTHIWPWVNTSRQNGSALISDHVKAHRIGKALHLHPTPSCQKGTSLTSDHV